MEIELNYHQLFDSTHVEELLNCGFETSFSSQTEESYSEEPIQEISLNEHFMERLLQMETEFSAELAADQEIGENAADFSKVNNSYVVRELKRENVLYDLLLTGARAIEASNWSLASIVIDRLITTLSNQENEENPFHKMVFHFTQALDFRSQNGSFLFMLNFDSMHTHSISTLQALVELSPHLKFGQFTANQAILEATQVDREVQIIDFDIMDGIQWPPLMVDLASRNGVSLRLVAILWGPQNAGLIQRTGKRLSEFANSIGLPFKFDHMVIKQEEDFDKIGDGHTFIANCMIDQFHMPRRDLSLVKTFLNGVSRLHPKRIVLVEEELFNFAKIPSMSFEEFISEAFLHYNALSESLLYSFSSVGFGLDERGILGNRILDCVRQFPIERREKMVWEEGFSSLKGFKRIPISSPNVSQAKLLVGLYGKGYWVQHENFRLSLSWESRPLVTASIWIPQYEKSC